MPDLLYINLETKRKSRGTFEKEDVSLNHDRSRESYSRGKICKRGDSCPVEIEAEMNPLPRGVVEAARTARPVTPVSTRKTVVSQTLAERSHLPGEAGRVG